MVRSLLVRGMLVGVVTGLLVFACAQLVGEPQVDRSIAFEVSADKTKGIAPEPEIVSRRVQKTFGLLTGVVVYGAALGGIFSLAFAYSYGRFGPSRPRALSALLAGLGFVTIAFVPSLKYPANPPAVGNPETIGIRTAAFFVMVLVSVVAMVLAIRMSRRMVRRFGPWNGTLLSTALFLVVVSVAGALLPIIDEVPLGFPADVLWSFRVSAWALQVVLWGTLGLLFGYLTERDPKWSWQARHT
jgi:Probable cobalt transporter subunit (CbtA)